MFDEKREISFEISNERTREKEFMSLNDWYLPFVLQLNNKVCLKAIDTSVENVILTYDVLSVVNYWINKAQVRLWLNLQTFQETIHPMKSAIGQNRTENSLCCSCSQGDQVAIVLAENLLSNLLYGLLCTFIK